MYLHFPPRCAQSQRSLITNGEYRGVHCTYTHVGVSFGSSEWVSAMLSLDARPLTLLNYTT